MSEAETTGSISNICIGNAQRKLKETPSGLILVPRPSGNYLVDDSVIAGPQNRNTTTIGRDEELLSQVATLGETWQHMCKGEFESLKAIYSVPPYFAPKSHAWRKYARNGTGNVDTYFLLAEFRDVGQQPTDPVKLVTRLAGMHQRSVSPPGKFDFHISTCHAKITQVVNSWEESWCVLYTKHLGHVMGLAKPILQWPKFDVVCKLTLEKVVPRLLLPLQSDDRVLKPSIPHGDCWDGNTAMDMKTSEAFVFDVCSFYGHKE
ncbi:hypothetical protein G7Y89_g14895 [Cudoniella acicularis]|uniref:protein-ribulosamine 3-kinase n=1 Tax=Cudoniella acicularis TaxID=354080 RepID=A0A8H4QVY1_9HELO|nr:hypothetical protein G7Y89_g14895 [Cudoniella acicularis]